jgi:serine/threonine-protein kinase
MDEARIATRLSHPNVIRTREVIAAPPDYLLAMDFHDGQSLLHVLRRLGRTAVPLDEHVYILTKVLAGLCHAHELTGDDGKLLGIVHRDVSPANVLVSYTGEVKLIDFGIAKATGALAATQDGVVKGKLGYAAPEQCLGKPADPRSDVYAVGVMLWEAIAGRRRASGETWHSVLQARLEDAEPQLEEVCPDAPKALAAIVRKAIARNPDDRFATARQFQRELESYLAQRPGPKASPLRIAAMLKPHFDQDRKEQQRAIEAYLHGRESGGSGQRRVPLPGKAAASPKLAPPAPRAPVVEEEQTSRIPVDAALLIQTRAEAAAAEAKSRSTAPPPAGSVKTAPPPATSAKTTAPPPPSSATTAPPPSQGSVRTAPPPAPGSFPAPRDSVTSVPPRDSVTSVPPRDSATSAPPRDSVTSAPPRDSRTSSPTGRPSVRLTPSKSVPADAYGIVTVSKPAVPLALVTDAPTTQKKTRVWPALLVSIAAVAFSVFAFVTVRKTSNQQQAAKVETPAPPVAPPAETAPVQQKVDTVKVRISVDPADAVVKLDGHLLTTNPFASNLPRDNEVHELTAYAEGCRDLKQVVHLNQDVDLLVALKRIKGFVRSTAPRSAAVTAAAAKAAMAPAPAQPAAQAPAAPPAAAPAPAAPAAPEPGMDLQRERPNTAPARTADETNPY